MTHPTYPPLDTCKSVADGIWVVDSGPLRMMGIPIPVRMTVIRLAGGEVLLHSPTRCTGGLRSELQEIGPVRHLVAPSFAHWTFIKDWQAHYPDALSWAAPGLRERSQVKKSGVRIDRDLTNTPPPDWAGEIDQVIVPGGAGFRETAFGHRPSRTLVLTDLVVNVEPEKLPALLRPAARLAGVVAPHGKAPIYLRTLINLKRADAAKAAARLIEWSPERVIFSHGRWFEQDGTAQLRKSLRWLAP